MTRVWVLSLVAACMSAAAPTLAIEPSLDRVVSSKTLRVGVAINAPWVVKSQAGELTGYDIDLARGIARDLGVTASFVEMPFADLIPRLAKGDVDIVAAGLAVTPARAREIVFSDVTNSAAIRVVASRAVLGNDPVKALSAAGFTIAALAASTDADAARRAFPAAKVIEYPSAAEALAALLDGKAQAMAATAPVPRLTATLYDAKFQLLRRPLTHTPEAFALRPDDTRLLGFVNNWIAARRADGTIGNANDYWFGHMTWLRTLEPAKAAGAGAKPTER